MLQHLGAGDEAIFLPCRRELRGKVGVIDICRDTLLLKEHLEDRGRSAAKIKGLYPLPYKGQDGPLQKSLKHAHIAPVFQAVVVEQVPFPFPFRGRVKLGRQKSQVTAAAKVISLLFYGCGSVIGAAA
jgi:hypothetical protein